MSDQENTHQPTLVLQEDVELLRAYKNDFFATLSKPKIIDATVTEEDIDRGQEIAEKVECLRLKINPVFTAEELQNGDKFPYKTLQAIAKDNGVPANQSKEKVIVALTGVHKSLRVRRETIGKLYGRLKWARRVANYPHPRQQASTEAASSASSSLSFDEVMFTGLVNSLSKDGRGAQIQMLQEFAPTINVRIEDVESIIDQLCRENKLQRGDENNVELK